MPVDKDKDKGDKDKARGDKARAKGGCPGGKDAIKEVYLDFNGTAPISQEAIQAAEKWEALKVPANPSSNTPVALAMQKEIDRGGKALRKRYDFCAQDSDQKQCTVLWNSGASEGNSHVVRACVDAWWAKRKGKKNGSDALPAVLIGSTEHKAILLCAAELEKQGRCRAIFVDVSSSMSSAEVGKELEKAVQKAGGSGRVVLLSVMTFNNETGASYPQGHLREWANRRKVPFHCDDTQGIGKRKVKSVYHPTFVTGSFHKLGGPVGVGFLLINAAHPGFERIMGAKEVSAMPPMVHGTQQQGVRGGTMDVATIAASTAALAAFPKPKEWAKHAKGLRAEILSRLENKHGFIVKYRTPGDSSPAKEPHIAVLTPMATGLENTLLMSWYETEHKWCNVKMKKKLVDAGFLVSIGSACATNSKFASHVLKAHWPTDKCLWRGVLRISLGPSTTLPEVRAFADAYSAIVKNGCYL